MNLVINKQFQISELNFEILLSNLLFAKDKKVEPKSSINIRFILLIEQLVAKTTQVLHDFLNYSTIEFIFRFKNKICSFQEE